MLTVRGAVRHRPLAAMPGLKVAFTDDTSVIGTDRFPPDRIEVKHVRT